MAKINASPAVLERVARQLTDIAGDITTQQKRVLGTRESVGSAWKSQYTPLYLEDVGRVCTKLGGTSDRVHEIARQLRSTAAEIRRLERELAEKNRASR